MIGIFFDDKIHTRISIHLMCIFSCLAIKVTSSSFNFYSNFKVKFEIETETIMYLLRDHYLSGIS